MKAFSEALLDCREEDSPIGDLASDAHADKSFPRNASDDEVRRYLQTKQACPEAMEAFDEFRRRFMKRKK